MGRRRDLGGFERGMSEPCTSKSQGRLRSLIAVLLVPVFAIALFYFIGAAFELVIRLLVGWMPYLATNLPGTVFKPGMILSCMAALAFAVWQSHDFIGGLRTSGDERTDPRPWPLSATFTCIALLLMVSAAAIGVTGIVRQTGWLVSDPITKGPFARRSPVSQATQQGTQVHKGFLVHILDTGSPPRNLEELQSEFGYENMADFRTSSLYSPRADGDQWLYFPEAMASSDENKIVLASPAPIHKKWIVIFADGSYDTPETLHGLDLPFHPAPALDPMPAAER